MKIDLKEVFKTDVDLRIRREEDHIFIQIKKGEEFHAMKIPPTGEGFFHSATIGDLGMLRAHGSILENKE